ncbi:MAG: hypothetical protein ACLP2H_15910 [Terriglobales bacterium]
MVADDELLRAVLDYFVLSHDFNGVPASHLVKAFNIGWPELQERLGELIAAQQVSLAFASHSVTPHIKRLPDLPIDVQLAKLAEEGINCICIYPSADNIATRPELRQYDDRPYTRRLALVEPQLVPVFFELSVLEKYFRDPRYVCWFGDRAGSISVKDEHYQSEQMADRDKVLLQTFGIGYDQARNRVVVVYLRYLSDLSAEHQQTWRAQEVSGRCTVNSDYFRASILGEWPEFHSVYEAFIQEQVEINKLASLIGKPNLFKCTFEERPIEFSPMLRPTRRNFENFAHALDKMLSENLNRAFFKGDIPLEDMIGAAGGGVERRPVNTITALERWLSTHYRTRDGEDVAREVVEPFREVRKARQPAAHTLGSDEYDQSFPKQQDETLGRVTISLTKLRLVLSSHPGAKDYTPPEWLDGDKIVFY